MLSRRTYVTFESDYPLAESVARLSAATRGPSLTGSSSQDAVGKVTAKRVRLVRVIPCVRNDFKPVFRGAFEETDGHVVLRGSFGMHALSRAFIWFSVLFGLTVSLVGAVKGEGINAWSGLFMVLVMAALVGGLVALARWFARNDEAWLSNVIQQALRREAR